MIELLLVEAQLAFVTFFKSFLMLLFFILKISFFYFSINLPYI